MDCVNNNLEVGMVIQIQHLSGWFGMSTIHLGGANIKKRSRPGSLIGFSPTNQG
jgi:hypothetical protein